MLALIDKTVVGMERNRLRFQPRRLRENTWRSGSYPHAFKLIRMAERKIKAAFVEPMLLLKTEQLPEGESWLFELKFDGNRSLAIKSGGKVRLYSRNGNDFTDRYVSITKAFSALPRDRRRWRGGSARSDGRPSFNTLPELRFRGRSPLVLRL